MAESVVVLSGDGIGPEIMSPTLTILDEVTNDLEYIELPVGGASIDQYRNPLTPYTLGVCQRAGAVLLGAVGGPQWESNDRSQPRPEQALLGLRGGLELYANLRPVHPLPALYDASPLENKRIEGTDLLIVRELTGGIYFGPKQLSANQATDTCTYTKDEVRRIAHVAFQSARHKVTSVDKANVLETSKLWREVVTDIHDVHYPNIELEHMLIDKTAMELIRAPRDFDVVLTENMFGDILSDEAAMLTGSIGMLPSASLGKKDTPGLFEPIHGSAPDIAGKGIANPLAMFLSAAMMLRLGFNKQEEATAIESAVGQAIVQGLRTFDLGGKADTATATRAVLDNLAKHSGY